MVRIQRRTTVLAGAVLLALTLPLAAQAPDATDPPAEPVADAAAEPAAEAAVAAPAADDTTAVPAIPANDPSTQTSEMQPRAPRSLLTDTIATSAGLFVVGERGHVLSSANGQLWKQIEVPTRSVLTSIASAEGQLWVGGHDGVILHSPDGGQTWYRRRAMPWSAQSTDPTNGAPVLDLIFSDAQNGIAVGAYSLLLTTSDGGLTWKPQSIRGDAAIAAAEASAAAPVADGAGEEAGGGDADWTFDADELSLDAESDPHLNAIARTGSGGLLIAGERGSIFSSRDGGASWTQSRLSYEGSMLGVLAWDGEHVLVFGLRGNVFESSDLGTTWSKVETGTSASIMGGAALAGGGAVLVGANGVILVRKDAASPFTATTYANAQGETPVLSGVQALDDGSYLLIGEKGVDLYRPQ